MRRNSQNTLTARSFEIREAGTVIVLGQMRRNVMVCAKAMMKTSLLAKRALKAVSAAADQQHDDARPVAQRRGWQALVSQARLLPGLLGLPSLHRHLGEFSFGHTGSATPAVSGSTLRGITRMRFERGEAYRPSGYRISIGSISG